MANERMNCKEARGRLEARGEDRLARRHAEQCAGCAEYIQLQTWSRGVVKSAELQVTPPLMSSVWASIHRASEQAWDSALTRSFRYLLPYMVAVVAIIVLVGSLISPRSSSPVPVQAASTAFSVLNSPETPSVVNVMTTANLPSDDPADVLGVGHK